MRTKDEIIKKCAENIHTDRNEQIFILEAMLDIRDTLVEIEKRLTEIGGEVEDIGGEARMNQRIQTYKER